MVIRILLAFSTYLFLTSSQTVRAETPILPFPSVARDQNLFLLGLRDGNSSLVEETSPPDIGELLDKIKASENDADEDKKRTPSELEDILVKVIRASEAIEDVKFKKVPGAVFTTAQEADLSQLKLKKEKILFLLTTAYQNNPERLSQFKFYTAASSPDSSLSKQTFLELSANKKASTSIRNRALAVVTYDRIRSDAYVRDARKLKEFIESRKDVYQKSNLAFQLQLNLITARALAGIHDTAKVRNPDPLYKKYLNDAVKNLAGVAKAIREKAIDEVLWIWRSADPKDSWFSLPFDAAAIKNTETIAAIHERRSLELYAKGQIMEAIKITRNLEDSLPSKTPWRIRLLAWHKASWMKSNQFLALETEISRQLDTEKTPDRPAALTQEYLSLIKAEALKAKKKPEAGKLVIPLADRYLAKTKPSPDHKAEILELTAVLYQGMGQNKDAGIRQNAAGDIATKKENKIRLYGLAIKSQSKVAGWSEEAPWFKNKAKVPSELSLLRKYYGDALDQQPDNWKLAAHSGLIAMAQNETIVAFKLWNQLLQKNTSGIHANNAAWLMLTTYQNAKQWEDLEVLARLLVKARVNPKANGKSLSSSDLLALALYEGGTAAFATSNFQKAILKLTEYVDAFSKPNEDHALWLLSMSLHKTNRFIDAIVRAHDMTKRFPTSKEWLIANATAFQWSEDAAQEPYALIFSGNYLSRDGKSDKGLALRRRLIQLLIGLERYGLAIARIKEHQQTGRLSKQEDLDCSYQILYLEEHYGKSSSAFTAAETVLRKNPNNWQKAEAFGAKAKYLGEKNDLSGISKLEAQVSALSGDDYLFVQKSAQMRLTLAKAVPIDAMLRTVNNITLKDPKAALKTKIDEFGAYERRMKTVCDIGPTAYCALALITISNTGAAFLPVLNDININPTLGDEETVPYNTYKKSAMDRISALMDSSEKKAYDIVIDGESDPTTALDVIWRTSNDWNFEPVTGSEGKGYVQLQITKGAN
ncbi:MAG: hypothetical protein WCI18_10665 [Pseudomonadota bacterium]